MTKTRIIAALIMAPIVIAAILLLKTPWIAAFSALILMIGLWEWFALAGVKDSLPRTILITLNLSLMVLMVWASSMSAEGGRWVLFELTTMLGGVAWVASLFWLKFSKWGSQPTLFNRCIKLVAASFAVIPAWAALVLLHGKHENGAKWVLTLLFLVWAADSGAYFAGRRWGKHKLAPNISPNKTIEGLIGGLATALVIGIGFGVWIGMQSSGWIGLMAVSLIAVVFSVVGDLIESLLKRQAGAKDSGKLIPGHGGVLDRIDSLLAALPMFVLGKEISGFAGF